jgi:Fe2+ or Zn2+ uptake regulation protein
MYKNTVQRQIIFDIVKNFETHPTVEEVYAEIQKRYRNISKSTVYRNLRQLAQDGEIGQVSFPDDSERYDRRADQHYHFKCSICGVMYDVDIEYIDGINDTVQEKYGFQVDAHDLVFRGTCPKCR